MKIHSALRMGAFHTHHCEDFLVSFPITNTEHVIAVMDGCSMATESVFASMLVGKILRNIGKHWFFQDFVEPDRRSLDEKLEALTKSLFQELKHTKNQLGLETNELLSTLLLGVIDKQRLSAELLAIGDGVVCADHETITYEQNNRPDYLGYHLNESFDTWYAAQAQRLSLAHFEDLSLSTDGILSFKNLANTREHKPEQAFIDFLLKDLSYQEQDNFLERKLMAIEKEWQQVPTDDIGIIRVML